MSGGFRRLLGWRETARTKAFLLAIALQMIGFLAFWFVYGSSIWVPSFSPLGVVLGGLMFGLAMGWGGGCPAGIWYKMGGGDLTMLVSIVGAIAGFVSMESGFLRSMRLWLQTTASPTQGKGILLAKWLGIPHVWLATSVAVALLFFLFRADSSSPSGFWSWRKTGFWVGLIGIAAWWSSSLMHRPFGMSLMNGTRDAAHLFFDTSVFFHWEFLFVIGVPVGGWIGAQQMEAFQWISFVKRVSLKRLVGGFFLGASASLAGGCTVGHGLTGIPLLSVGSLLFILFAILGTWLFEWGRVRFDALWLRLKQTQDTEQTGA